MANERRATQYRTYGSAAYQPQYEGNTVRRSGQRTRRHEEPVRRPRVQPRTQTVARPSVEVRQQTAVAPFAIVGFIAVILCALMLVMSSAKLAMVKDQTVELRSTLADLQQEEKILLAQYELAYDLKSIETAVTADGRMVKPQNSQIHYMDLSGSDSVVVYESGATATIGSKLENLMDTVAEYLP